MRMETAKKIYMYRIYRLNKKGLNRNYILHSELQKGGILQFTMTNVPNEKRGTKEEDFPYSMSK